MMIKVVWIVELVWLSGYWFSDLWNHRLSNRFFIDKLLKIQYLLNHSRDQGSKVQDSLQGPLLFTLNAFIIGRTFCKGLKETAIQAYTIHPVVVGINETDQGVIN